MFGNLPEGKAIEVEVTKISGSIVKIGVKPPQEIAVRRKELKLRVSSQVSSQPVSN